MAKAPETFKPTPAQTETKVADKVAPVVLTLQEFCTRLSESDRRVNLIGAFEFNERSTSKLHDTEDAYRARYNAFLNRPA